MAAPASDRSGSSAASSAAAAAQQRRARANIAAVVAVVLVLGVGAYFFQRSQESGPIDAPAAGASEYGVTVGDPEAPHQVIVYEDFLCPFCGEFEKVSGERLAAAAAAGKVYVEYRPFVLLSRFGDYSERATNAFVLDASGPVVAKKFHDLLYADQPSEEGPFPDDDWLVEKAVAAGAEEDAVRPGIEDLSQSAWVKAATQEAEDSGIAGTPTVLLDGEQQGGSTVDDVADAVLERVG